MVLLVVVLVVVLVLVVGVVVLVWVEVVVGTVGAMVVDVGSAGELELLVAPFPPVSAAITTTATISPITAATRIARAHFRPRLIPPPGG